MTHLISNTVIHLSQLWKSPFQRNMEISKGLPFVFPSRLFYMLGSLFLKQKRISREFEEYSGDFIFQMINSSTPSGEVNFASCKIYSCFKRLRLKRCFNRHEQWVTWIFFFYFLNFIRINISNFNLSAINSFSC